MTQCKLHLLNTVYFFLSISLFVQTLEVTNKTTFARLFGPLEAFTTYCVYLMVQFINNQGVRSAHSQVLGPQCVNTTPGGMLYMTFICCAISTVVC